MENIWKYHGVFLADIMVIFPSLLYETFSKNHGLVGKHHTSLSGGWDSQSGHGEGGDSKQVVPKNEMKWTETTP